MSQLAGRAQTFRPRVAVGSAATSVLPAGGLPRLCTRKEVRTDREKFVSAVVSGVNRLRAARRTFALELHVEIVPCGGHHALLIPRRLAQGAQLILDRFKNGTRPLHVRCWQHFSPVQAPPRTESWVICWSLAAMSLRMSL